MLEYDRCKRLQFQQNDKSNRHLGVRRLVAAFMLTRVLLATTRAGQAAPLQGSGCSCRPRIAGIKRFFSEKLEWFASRR